MNGRFRMQGGKNWILPKVMNANRFFWDSHWLEIWSNHLYPSMEPNGGIVVMDSHVKNLINLNRNSWRRQWKLYSHWSILRRLQPHSRCAIGWPLLFLLPLLVDSAETSSDYKPTLCTYRFNSVELQLPVDEIRDRRDCSQPRIPSKLYYRNTATPLAAINST